MIRQLLSKIPSRRRSRCRAGRSLPWLAALLLWGPIAGAGEAPVLPAADPVFQGRVGPSLAESEPHWPALREAVADAPNVVLIMTDDVGFGATSTFGGPVPTPHLDRLAADGLRYNNFHTTAMCSPTRAALLSGRNHHAVGFGALSNLSMGFPGYWSELPRSAATVARILGENGYNTSFFGKHHGTPYWMEAPVAGPFDQWPTGRWGFEYFYGFIGADTDQWNPKLFRNTSAVDTSGRDPELLLDRDLADDAIRWLHGQKANAPDKPFFLYFAPGSAHSPHQAPADWIARFQGRFDHGWDVEREQTFARQKQQGVIPADAVLTARPAEIAAWESLSADQQRVYARHMEVYAAMLAYQDEQIGRILAELERMGLGDDTLVIFIQGDNGGSGEGGAEGTFNELQAITHQGTESLEWQLENLDKLGGPETYSVYPAGWGWATNSPFPYMKQLASHLGGVRNGLVISWPQRITRGGEVRSQFHHVIDVMPTILDAAGVRAPVRVDGIEQQPIDGLSMSYTFADGAAPGIRDTQYFELLGNRAIYHQGWMANTTPARMPWQAASDVPPESFVWELYDLRNDFSQSRNLAAERPDKLRELIDLWEREAERNQVLPLRASLGVEYSEKLGRPQAPRSNWVLWGADISLPWKQQPVLTGRDFSLVADLELDVNARGVVVATGSYLGGWAFYLDGGRPVAEHVRSHEPQDRFRIAARQPLPEGAVQVRFDFTSAEPVPGAGGTLRISAGGRVLAEGAIAGTALLPNGVSETFDVGFDSGGQVSDAYSGGGRFSGVIRKVEVIAPAPAR